MLISFCFLRLGGIFNAVSTAAVPLVVKSGLCWELQGLGQADRLTCRSKGKGGNCDSALYISAKSEWDFVRQRKGTPPPGGLNIKCFLHTIEV